MGMTTQFPMCGNCFRVDTYRGCSFGCIYCFANARKYTSGDRFQIGDLNLFKKWFEEALDKNETNNLNKELLNRKTPLHLGGMSDPFQKREWKHGVTKGLLELSKEYDYPINISTKAAYLPEEYWKILDPRIHTFSISLIGTSDEYIRKFERATPLPGERIQFIKELHDKGFWVSIRIQPVIDMNEVLQLIEQTEDFVDYYTIEHLKIPIDNPEIYDELIPLLKDIDIVKVLVCRGREFEFSSATKLKNIKRIKQATKVKVGVGDNEFHTMSDSINCCGIDTMPPAFNNWLKYNSMAIKMTGNRNVYYPKKFNKYVLIGKMRIDGFGYRDYVEKYYENMYGNDNYKGFFNI